MFDAPFRRLLAPVLRRPAAWLSSSGVTANQVTVAGFLVGAGAAALLAAGRPVAAMLLWLASRLLDAVDGAVARAAGPADAFGGFLDITLDMAAYSLMVVAFAVTRPDHLVMWLLILVGYVLCITTTAVLSSLLEQRRTRLPDNDRSLQFTAGFAEGGETTIVYLLLVLVPGQTLLITVVWVAVLMATAVQRTLLARRLLRD